MKIVYVDGFKIRNTLDDDFADFHFNIGFSRYVSKYYIPKNEIWIDHIFKISEEVDFLFKIYEENERYFKNNPTGLGYKDFLRKTLCSPGPAPSFKIKKEIVDGFDIVYVNGKTVRQYLDTQFVFGGHSLVYDYIPKNEIWLDTVTDSREIPYFLVHEKHERDLMEKGKSYDTAHRFASAADMEQRIKDGYGAYPGDVNYPWVGLSNEEIIKKYVVS